MGLADEILFRRGLFCFDGSGWAYRGFLFVVLVDLIATCLAFLSTVLAARSWTRWFEFSLSAILAD